MTVEDEKTAIRRTVRERLATHNDNVWAQRDAHIIKQLSEMMDDPAAWVLGYAALADEVNIDTFLRHRLNVNLPLFLPRVTAEPHIMDAYRVYSFENDLEEGAYHIREPLVTCPFCPPEKITCILVPGRAFSTDGIRVGRGGGYYDRYLPKTKALRIGVAYEEQLFDALPSGPHDARMDMIVTPQRVITCSP